MAEETTAHLLAGRARLRKSTTVLLVGNIELTMAWYKGLGFEARYFPPGFGILRRDDVEIFLQHYDATSGRMTPAHTSAAPGMSTWKPMMS
jgi:hypothetical protein